MPRPFLTARWDSLVLLNYSCPPDLLAPLVPAGTELDTWRGRHLVSLVGFRFLETRVKGFPIPGHQNFEEVNLRFYVRRAGPEGIRRGVVFVRELVPRRAIATVARLVYNEPYLAVPMTHSVSLNPETGGTVDYSWKHRGEPYSIRASVDGPARNLVPESEAEFITEHYWGYNTQRDGSSLEYRVEHPRWKVWDCSVAEYRSPPDTTLYGAGFTKVLGAEPVSSHLAMGSVVEVYSGVPVGTG